MDTSEDERANGGVGYKRPPKEHQFKKGQKPPPRKKRPREGAPDLTRIFWQVMQQQRRVKVEGAARWATTAELVVRRAFMEAEAGSSTLQRLLNDLLLYRGDDDPGYDVAFDLGDGKIIPQKNGNRF